MASARRRIRSALAATLAAAAVALTTAAAPSGDPYAAPTAAVPLGTSVGTNPGASLDARYGAVRHDIARAWETATRVHDSAMRRSLADLLAPGRQFLSFDARGSGRVVEVFGDLASAERIAVVVPGADGRVTNFDSRKFAGGGARALAGQIRAEAPDTDVAVVAWLGYAAPASLSPAILTDGRAIGGSHRLEGLVAELRTLNPAASVALLCHSYGSVVCAKAADGPSVDDIAFFGSPGTGVDEAEDLHTDARVWAGRGSHDWIQLVPHASLLGFGFGADPVSRGYHARVFDAGSVGHSDYFKPGTASLRNLARIALGRESEVGRADYR
ncbi:alpha/beta hydrolase [Streptodolium elevatio]|uniref:Alpha/beta hydrolase n=1 Tax=Streptodolium elevatio TaxID=3157996 RepID=A0ABV3DCS5_9ACTN